MTMKVFVPMCDAALGDNGEVCQRLVPFDPSFLSSHRSVGEGRKPSNWISDSNYEQARERLLSAQA